MTAVWDIVRAFLTGIGEVKDPESYKTALEFMKRLISDIHDVDHDQGEWIAKLIGKQKGFRDIEKFMKELKKRR